MAREEAETQWRRFQGQIRDLCDRIVKRPESTSLLEPFQAILKTQQRMKDLHCDVREMEYDPTRPKVPSVVTHRTMKCPGSTDSCQGYIPISGPGCGHCPVCNMRICTECNMKLPNEEAIVRHKADGCKEEDRLSVQFIRENSTSCPKCGTPIQKIDGCDQMWCTVPGCNTAFNYKTRTIINGAIHNPHYHEWLRQNPNGPAAGIQRNLDCNNVGVHYNAQMIYQIFRTSIWSQSKVYELLVQWCRILPELHQELRYHMRQHEDRLHYGPETYEDLRRKYLSKKISKEAWAKQLSFRETHRIKQSKLHALHAMYIAANYDIYLVFYQTAHRKYTENLQVTIPVTHEHELLITEFVNSLENLRIYYMQQLCRVLSDYSDSYVGGPMWTTVNEVRPGQPQDIKGTLQLVYKRQWDIHWVRQQVGLQVHSNEGTPEDSITIE
jgi:hypothetical protein